MENYCGKLFHVDGAIYKAITVDCGQVLVINCLKMTMPKWEPIQFLESAKEAGTEELPPICHKEDLDGKNLSTARKRYTIIAGILPFIDEDKMRNAVINRIAERQKLSRRSVCSFLCRYLVYEDIGALADKPRKQKKRHLTWDEKNYRWALNKYYYTHRGNSLMDAFVQMLKERYCDENGRLFPDHPSIHQFRYYYRKTRKIQTEIITRKGIKEYQLNYRPLLGDGVQEMAPAAGWGMLDGTICDIYLVNEGGSLVGRPILLAAVDAYSGICIGYALLWEGGVYSVRELLLNTITDKVKWCRRFGIEITENIWPCSGSLPGTLICDRGSEYISYNLEQITELGCQLVSLPSFSANLKGPVEKLFDLIQDAYKPFLKGKGVIEPDFQKRGAQDYRKESCLTMEQFEKIVVHCILYHNSQRVLEDFPYTDDMFNKEIKPYANAIWEYGRTLPGANLIPVGKEALIKTLLPRTQGYFTRKGLVVNGLRYTADGFTEQFLKGGSCIVAYNPDNVGYVFLVQDGYTKFDLIERRYVNLDVEKVVEMKNRQSRLNSSYKEKGLQARIDLARHIESIAGQESRPGNIKMKEIRKTRKKEREIRHRDLLQEVIDNEE